MRRTTFQNRYDVPEKPWVRRSITSLERRRFVRALAAAAAAFVTMAVVLDLAGQPERVSSSPDPSVTDSGYRATEHVQRYDRTTRIDSEDR